MSSMYNPTPYAGARDNTQVFIDELVMFRARGYQDQYLRPNRTHIDGDTIGEMTEMVAYHNGHIPSEHAAALTTRFIMPSDRPETIHRNGRAEFMDVKIPHGWSEARFVFMMKVRSLRAGMGSVELVTGYTDRIDTVRVRHGVEEIAPDTVFTINSVSNLKRTGHLSDTMSILGGGLGNGYYHGQVAMKMTPMNLIHSGTVQAHSGLSDMPADSTALLVSDTKHISDMPSAVLRRYGSPTDMMTGVLRAFGEKYTKMQSTGVLEQDSIVNETISRIVDPSIRSSQFIRLLTMRKYHATATFTYGDLMSIDPTIDDRAVVSENFFETTQFSSPWESPTEEAQMALVISNMVTSLMTQMSIAVLDFSAFTISGYGGLDYNRNFNLVEEFVTTVTNLQGVAMGLDMRAMVPTVESEIERNICRVLHGNEQREFTISVSAKLNKDIVIEIAFFGQPVEMFVFPSFADALINPAITTSTDRYNNSARDVNYLINDIYDNLASRGTSLRPMPDFGAKVSDAIPLSTTPQASSKRY